MPSNIGRKDFQDETGNFLWVNLFELLDCTCIQTDWFSWAVSHSKKYVAATIIGKGCKIAKVFSQSSEIELFLKF